MSFFRRNQNKIIWITVVVIIFMILTSTSKGRKGITAIERVIGSGLRPIKKAISSVSINLSNKTSNVKNFWKTFEENKELKERLVELESKNREYENIIGKSEMLRRQADMLEKTEYKLEEAKITAKEPGNWFDRFTIDKGSSSGIEKDDIVLQAIELDNGSVIEGLVGRVIDVGEDWSKVVSIVDEINKMSFKVTRTQDGGVLSGNRDSKMEGYLYDANADVIKGDRVLTSGLGGLYREGLYVGTISEVKEDEETMVKNVKVESAVNFKKLYNVYILKD